MEGIPALKVTQRYAQFYRKQLGAKGVLDLQHCMEKHADGTVTIPILRSNLDDLNLHQSGAESGSCEIIHIQYPQVSKRGKVKSWQERMIKAVQELAAARGVKWSKELEEDLPKGWQCHGDLVLLGKGCFSDMVWTEIGTELWEAVVRVLGAKRLAQIKQVSANVYRTPEVVMLLGDNSYVTHIDNHIRYEFDVTKCMFSFGNITEKLRIASFNCTGETVVDLYAGIGYFTLPYLVHAGAAHVHACEWNPEAVTALRRNLHLNWVAERCTVHPGDNKQLSLSNLADRVNLGLIPSSEEGWRVACRLLRTDVGGILHIHHNVTTPVHRCQEPLDSLGTTSEDEDEKPLKRGPQSVERDMWNSWAEDTAKHIAALLRDITKGNWRTEIKHIEHVKSYAPHVSHIVLDLECKPAY